MYKLTTFVYENDFKKNLRYRKYITVKTNLTWQEAKTDRSKDRSLQIVKAG